MSFVTFNEGSHAFHWLRVPVCVMVPVTVAALGITHTSSPNALYCKMNQLLNQSVLYVSGDYFSDQTPRSDPKSFDKYSCWSCDSLQNRLLTSVTLCSSGKLDFEPNSVNMHLKSTWTPSPMEINEYVHCFGYGNMSPGFQRRCEWRREFTHLQVEVGQQRAEQQRQSALIRGSWILPRRGLTTFIIFFKSFKHSEIEVCTIC